MSRVANAAATAWAAPVATAASPAEARRRAESLGTVASLLLLRVGVATLLMVSLVAVSWSQGGPESLGGPFARFVFALLATTYGSSLAYAVTLKRLHDPVTFAYVPIAVDLALITALVHATGGGQSAFHFLYLVEIVGAALLPARHGTLAVAAAAALLMVVVCAAGYAGVLPLVPGQSVFPWDIAQRELLTRLVINLAGLASVAALGTTLSAQRRQAGERLVRHERYAGDLASLHENTIRCLSSGLVTVTPDGLISSINEAAADILGIDKERAVGEPLRARIPGLGALLEEVGPVGTVRRQEVDAIRPDGLTRRLGISATPLSDHTGRSIGRVIHFQDLTDLRRMELAVARAERLASIGRLAAGIAHEIRNPLAGISGSLEVLRTVPGADDDSRQLMSIAIREADRLNSLISALLDYARPSTEERHPLDLGELVHDIAKVFEREKTAGADTLRLDIATGVKIEGAPGQLRQVIWNLLRNAREALGGNGGAIEVHVAHEELTTGGREALLAVVDSGVGIPPEHLEHIFEPFFTRGKVGGTGLGLATVARIVADHRGTIEVQSTPGRGSRFTLRLPLCDVT